MEKMQEIMIGKLFKEIFPIEWLKYNMFHNEDIYLSIPYLLYRYEEGYDKICELELKKCLKTFKGNLEWVTYHPDYIQNQNYILTLKVYYDKLMDCEEKGCFCEVKKEFGEKYEELCEKAIEDIPNLECHIRQWMELNLPEMKEISTKIKEKRWKRKKH